MLAKRGCFGSAMAIRKVTDEMKTEVEKLKEEVQKEEGEEQKQMGETRAENTKLPGAHMERGKGSSRRSAKK